MKRSTAEQLGISIEGVFRSFSVCGVPPDIMGIGPAIAIPKALEKAGLMKEDIDIFELNEAFASQAIYCIEKLGLPVSRGSLSKVLAKENNKLLFFYSSESQWRCHCIRTSFGLYWN